MKGVEHAEEVVEPRSRRLQVLVVDDVPEICELYRMVVSRIRGIDIDLTVSSDTGQALELIRDNAYDVVVSDFRMPRHDGIEILCAAREANPRGRRVLMTGYHEVPTPIARIMRARIDAYLSKPLKTPELLLVLTDLLIGDEARLSAYRADAQEMEAIALREEGVLKPRDPTTPTAAT